MTSSFACCVVAHSHDKLQSIQQQQPNRTEPNRPTLDSQEIHAADLHSSLFARCELVFCVHISPNAIMLGKNQIILEE